MHKPITCSQACLSVCLCVLFVFCLHLSLLKPYQSELRLQLFFNMKCVLPSERAFKWGGVCLSFCVFLGEGGYIPDVLPWWQGAPCRRRVSAKLGAMVTGWWQTLWRVCWDTMFGSTLKTHTYVDTNVLTHSLDTGTKYVKCKHT